MSSPTRIILLASYAFLDYSALSIQHLTSRSSRTLAHPRHLHRRHPTHPSTALRSTAEEDETLLSSVELSTLVDLCSRYSLSPSGTKRDLLSRLRRYADDQAERDRIRKEGRKRRVEDHLDGKARHTFIDEQQPPWSDAEEDDDEGGYFYFDAGESDDEKKNRQEEKTKQRSSASKNPITAPDLKDVVPNEKGERVVTIYSTADDNDLTGMQSPSMSTEETGHKP